MPDHISPKQQRIIQAIEAYSATHGHPPSYRELMEELGYRSTGSIYRFVKALKEEGVLQKGHRSWRNLQPTPVSATSPNDFQVEVIGRICRGSPPELLPKTYMVTIPSHLAEQGSHLYGLVIQDASFVQDHFLPNDLVLVEPIDAFTNGELVLASTHETIIGHYFDEDPMVRFRSTPYASGGSIESITLPRDEVQLWGVIVALIRSLSLRS
jgi:repressor LexA